MHIASFYQQFTTSGVVIGFDPKRGVFSEESGRGQFTVRAISGRLDSSTSVAVLLNTASCTADSKYYLMYGRVYATGNIPKEL